MNELIQRLYDNKDSITLIEESLKRFDEIELVVLRIDRYITKFILPENPIRDKFDELYDLIEDVKDRFEVIEQRMAQKSHEEV